MVNDVNDVVQIVALAATLLIALVWAPAHTRPKTGLLWRRVAAWPPLVQAISLAVYVASEDDYRRMGRSRWETYDAQPVTCLAIGAGLVTAALGFALRQRPHWAGMTAGACLASSVITYLALIQMTN